MISKILCLKKEVSFNKLKMLNCGLILFCAIILTSCNSSISPSTLKGTEWVSDDGKIKLEFKTETVVMRDDSMGGEYIVEGNIVTIGNAFTKIPLTYENGKLTGSLNQGETNVLTKK